MVRSVEIDLVDAGFRAIEIDVAAARIRLRRARQIVERHEQLVQVRRAGLHERRQLQRLSFQRELERADAPHLALRAGGGRHVDDRRIVRRLQGRRHVVLRIDREVGERQQLVAALGWNRRLLVGSEVVVLDGALRRHLCNVVLRVPGRLAGACSRGQRNRRHMEREGFSRASSRHYLLRVGPHPHALTRAGRSPRAYLEQNVTDTCLLRRIYTRL